MAAEAQKAIEAGQFHLIAFILDSKEIEEANNLLDWPAALHLLGHIYSGNLEDARMLFKRLPDNLKRTPDIAAAFTLLQALWQKDYQGVWTALTRQKWSANLHPIVAAIAERTRLKTFALLRRAYSEVSVAKASALLGLPAEEVAKLATNDGWQLDSSRQTLKVQRQPLPPREWTTPSQIQRLTEYVVHLET